MTSRQPVRGTADLERRLDGLRADREAVRRAAGLRRSRDRSLRWHGAALLVVLAAMALAHTTRRVPSPERPEAVAIAAETDAALRAWRDGDLTLDATPRPVGERLTGATVRWFGEPLHVLTGEASGECYATSWDDRGRRQSRVLAVGLPCRPSPLVASSQPVHFARVAVVVRDLGAPYPWDRLLPPEERDRFTYLPSMVVLGGLALSISTRLVTIAISGRPAGQLTRGPRHPHR